MQSAGSGTASGTAKGQKRVRRNQQTSREPADEGFIQQPRNFTQGGALQAEAVTTQRRGSPPIDLPASEGSVEQTPGRPSRHLLTPEQETLMVEHLPIVRFIARRIHERLPQHVPIEDLYSAGVVGLLDAFGKFDPSKQVQFRSYAQFRIRGAILDSLRTLDWSPRELRRKGRAIEQAIQTLTAQFGRAPNDVEIAQKLNIDLAAYQQLLGELKGLEIGTLHSERSEDSGEEELVYLPNRPEDDPLFRFLHVSCANASRRPSASCPSASGWS